MNEIENKKLIVRELFLKHELYYAGTFFGFLGATETLKFSQ